MSEDTSIAALLTEQLDRLLAKEVNPDLILTCEREGLSRSFWEQLDALGAPLAMVPADDGGAGLGWADAERALRLVGYHAAPAPLGETIVAARLAGAAKLELPPGPLTLVSAALALDPSGNVTGQDDGVPWAGEADYFIAVAERTNERRLCVIPRAEAKVVATNSIGRIPGGRVTFNNAAPASSTTLEKDAEILTSIAVLRSLQIAGALERVLELAIDYANTRVQFGNKIGKFQAVQNLLALLAEEVAGAQVAAIYGARCIDRGENILQGVAAAKIRSSTAATRAAALAHQIFGAIGITEEHSLHLYTRRLWQWRGEGGSEHFWAERLGQVVLAAPGKDLWPSLTQT